MYLLRLLSRSNPTGDDAATATGNGCAATGTLNFAAEPDAALAALLSTDAIHTLTGGSRLATTPNTTIPRSTQK